MAQSHDIWWFIWTPRSTRHHEDYHEVCTIQPLEPLYQVLALHLFLFLVDHVLVDHVLESAQKLNVEPASKCAVDSDDLLGASVQRATG